MTLTTTKDFSVRVAMMLLMMLLTATTAWAFKAETTSYSISYSSNQFQITTGSTVTDSWTASTLQSQIYWKENESHQLAGMTIRPNQNVFYVSNSMHTTLNTSTTFTFTAPSTIAITSVVFKNGSNVVSGTNTASGSLYTVTLASGTSFTGFDVTYGTISGWCGTNATWSLSGTNYTVLTISGSGAMNDYSHDNASIWHTDAPWGYDLTSVTIGNGITSIGQYAFIGCQQLATATIGTSVTTLGAYAFNHCDALTQITLPASVASIGDQCFRNSANLQRVNIQRTDGLITLGDKVFNGCNNLQYIVAPTPTLAVQYKDATNWSASKDKLRVEFGGYLFSVTNEGGADAYAITDETDLRNLASVLNNNSEGIANGKTFRQTGDITLSNADFEPIGYNDYHYFTGTYDGGGDYTISGLNIVSTTGRHNYGLFGYVKNGTVKNVRLISPTVSAYGSGKNLGSLIGRTNNATVRNCVVVTPNIEGSQTIDKGAIIGRNENSTLQNLYFYGDDYDAIGGSYSGTDAVRVRKVIIGSGITSVTPAATDMANGFVHNNDRYYREGLELTLTNNLSIPTGQHVTYKANNKVISNPYTVNSTDGDVTLTAELVFNTYTVQFNKNHTDASGEMSNQSFTYGTAQNLTANAFNRTHYTFAGWNTKADGSGTSYANGESVSNLTTTDGGTVTLYAKWTPTTYTITYHLNGGTLDTDKNSYNIESPDITLDTPTRTGYIFDGWYTNSNLTGTPVTTITHGSTGNKEYWAKWLLPYIAYIDANGQQQETNSYTVLTGSESTSDTNLSPGWYVVTGNVSYNGRLICNKSGGNMHLVLCDGASLTINSSNNNAIYAINLTIYGQTLGTGTLNASSTGNECLYANQNLTINGGNVTATSSSDVGIYAYSGNVTINGGSVEASGGNYGNGIYAYNCVTINGGSVEASGGNGIYAYHGSITFGWTNVGDRITASNYYAPDGTVKTADGQSFHNGSEVISGTVSDKSKLNGKTLMGVDVLENAVANDVAALATRLGGKQTNVALKGRTLYKDGKWNTLCLPFDVTIADSPLAGDGVDVRTLDNTDFSNGTLTLDFTDKDAVTTLKAGKPYLVRWDKPDDYVAYDGTNAAECSDLVCPVFNGVTVSTATANVETDCVDFIGILSPTVLYEDGAEKTNLYMGSANKLYYPTVEGFKLNACRGYFKLKGVVVNGNGNDNGNENAIRSFDINFGDDATGIVEMRDEKGEMRNGYGYEDGGWYTVDGRRLDGKPAQKGLYIHGGRKVVIK